MPDHVYIYALMDPRNDTVRYVGQSVDPYRRWAEHLHGYLASLSGWIGSLKRHNLAPTVKVLAQVEPGEDPKAAETAWIIRLFDEGEPLLNRRVEAQPKKRVALDIQLDSEGLRRRVIERRTELGMRQADLAALAGLTGAGMCLIESGSRDDIRGSTLLKLSRALNVSVDFLLTGREWSPRAEAAE